MRMEDKQKMAELLPLKPLNHKNLLLDIAIKVHRVEILARNHR